MPVGAASLDEGLDLGMSRNRRIGKSRYVDSTTRPRSSVIPAESAESAHATEPSTCARTPSGLIATPQSTAQTMRSTRQSPAAPTVTSAITAAGVRPS